VFVAVVAVASVVPVSLLVSMARTQTFAFSIANTRGTYLAAKYRRIAARHGPKKALVAVEHAILIAI